MHARMPGSPPQEIFGTVCASLPFMDSINLTAAFQRLAKLLSASDQATVQARKSAIFASPVFGAMAREQGGGEGGGGLPAC
jgi:hypothetical protein